MQDFHTALALALELIAHGDPELAAIVWLSLKVSATAALIGTVIGAPLGVLLAATRFKGRQGLIVVANALLGLPPVVVGLAVYLILSRSGPLFAGWLFGSPGWVNAPFFIAGALKIVYDILVFRAFRSVKPPEEAVQPPAASPPDPPEESGAL